MVDHIKETSFKLRHYVFNYGIKTHSLRQSIKVMQQRLGSLSKQSYKNDKAKTYKIVLTINKNLDLQGKNKS